MSDQPGENPYYDNPNPPLPLDELQARWDALSPEEQDQEWADYTHMRVSSSCDETDHSFHRIFSPGPYDRQPASCVRSIHERAGEHRNGEGHVSGRERLHAGKEH